MPTGYAAFFDGCASSFTKSYGPFFLENRLNDANVYIQDDWRILDSLTLNLGLQVRARARAHRKARSDRLRLRRRQQQCRTAHRRRLRAHLGVRLSGQDQRWPRPHRIPRRIRDLRRPHLPIDLLADRRERPLQSAEAAVTDGQQPIECVGPHQRVRVHPWRSKPHERP